MELADLELDLQTKLGQTQERRGTTARCPPVPGPLSSLTPSHTPSLEVNQAPLPLHPLILACFKTLASP